MLKKKTNREKERKKDQEKGNFKEVKNNFRIIFIKIFLQRLMFIFSIKKDQHEILFNKLQVFDEDIYKKYSLQFIFIYI